MNVSTASLAPDLSVRKATPSDNMERTARSGAVVETIVLSRPRRAQCTHTMYESTVYTEGYSVLAVSGLLHWSGITPVAHLG